MYHRTKAGRAAASLDTKNKTKQKTYGDIKLYMLFHPLNI
jgi:hypothetical protein